MPNYEYALMDKIAFLTGEQQERVLRFVEDIEAKEPSTELKIVLRFEPYWIDIFARHPDRDLYWSGHGGEGLIDCLTAYFREKHRLLTSKAIAERIIYEIGSLVPMMPERSYKLVGRNLDTGLPDSVQISSIEVREQIAAEMLHSVKSVAGAINLLPRNMRLPEDVLVSATIRIRGRYEHLYGLVEAVQQATGLTVID